MEFQVFSIGGIPVRLSVWALLLIGWLAFRYGDPMAGAFAGVGVLVSVLIHEFGHAIIAARYGLMPSITLHAFGGFTMHQQAKTDGQDALILVAGATLQLIASAIFFAGWIGLGMLAPQFAYHPWMQGFGTAFLFVGVFWAVINLFPLWPLDGGKLFRLGLLRIVKVKPVLADQITHYTAIVGLIALILGFWLWFGSGFIFFIMFLFGFMVFQNIQALRNGRTGPVRRVNTHAKDLLGDARAAFQDKRWAEAARIGHQIRAEPEVSDRVLEEVFEIIALAHIFDGKLDEGVRFARRAPASPQVVAAQVKALLALGRKDEARTVLSDRGNALSFELKRDLEREVGA